MNKFFFFFLLLTQPIFSSKPEYWQYIYKDLGTVKDIKFTFKQEYRFYLNDFKLLDAQLSLLSKKNINKWLQTGINYTFNQTRNAEDTFEKKHRFEIELNPFFDLIKNVSIFIQNRFEFIKSENIPTWECIFRQKHQLSVLLEKKCIYQIHLSDELFYNFKKHSIDQYRIIPLEIEFRINKNYFFDIFSMIRWHKNADWHPQYVLGTSFKF